MILTSAEHLKLAKAYEVKAKDQKVSPAGRQEAKPHGEAPPPSELQSNVEGHEYFQRKRALNSNRD
jgi:hypothetical protein